MRTLHGKLSVFLLVLLSVIGLLWVQLTAITTRTYIREVNQNLNRDLAAHLARHLSDQHLLPSDLPSNPRVLARAKAEIKRLMVLNPDIEIYLLDTKGSIAAYSSAPGQVRRDRVALEPIRRFLATLGTLPILGDDPRQPGRQKTFSAARIASQTPRGALTKTFDGYVYIILGGQDYDAVAGMIGKSYVARWSAWATLLILTLVFGLGLLFFFALTRRLRGLTRLMEEFQAAGFRAETETSKMEAASSPRDARWPSP